MIEMRTFDTVTQRLLQESDIQSILGKYGVNFLEDLGADATAQVDK